MRCGCGECDHVGGGDDGGDDGDDDGDDDGGDCGGGDGDHGDSNDGVMVFVVVDCNGNDDVNCYGNGKCEVNIYNYHNIALKTSSIR